MFVSPISFRCCGHDERVTPQSPHALPHASPVPAHMRHIGLLSVFALACFALAVAAQDAVDYDSVEDSVRTSTPEEGVSLSDLDDANAWLARLRRRAENIAAARPVVNDAYRGLFATLGAESAESVSPWPRFTGRDASSDRKPFRFFPGLSNEDEEEGADFEKRLFDSPGAVGDAVLDSLRLSEQIIARTSADATAATANTAKVIQTQTDLLKSALAEAGTTGTFSSPFASSAQFGTFPASGPGSFPDPATVGVLADPQNYGTGLDGFESLYGQTVGMPDGFGGVAGKVATAGMTGLNRFYENAFSGDERSAHQKLAATGLSRLIDLTLEGQANAPVGRFFPDPLRVENTRSWMDGVKANAADKAFGESQTDLSSGYAPSFAEGERLVTELQNDDPEREALVRAEIDLADALTSDRE